LQWRGQNPLQLLGRNLRRVGSACGLPLLVLQPSDEGQAQRRIGAAGGHEPAPQHQFRLERSAFVEPSRVRHLVAQHRSEDEPVEGVAECRLTERRGLPDDEHGGMALQHECFEPVQPLARGRREGLDVDDHDQFGADREHVQDAAPEIGVGVADDRRAAHDANGPRRLGAPPGSIARPDG
jgi:hypothetical protein